MTNIKYYVVTIVSIFLALGVGIYIGFMLDAQDILITQRNDIVSQLEQRFDYLKEENEKLKNDIKKLEATKMQYERFAKTTFPDIVKNKLTDVKVAIIETNDDYIYSGIEQAIETSGGIVTSITTINDSLINDSKLIEMVNEQLISTQQGNNDNLNLQIENIIYTITDAIIYGDNYEIIRFLSENEIIDILGDYSIPIDYLIIAGGGKDNDNRVNLIDENIIAKTKNNNIPIVGVEKITVNYSYIDIYKNNRISTVDNVDTIIGKVALIMSMSGNPGNYGVKPSAEELLPNITSNYLD